MYVHCMFCSSHLGSNEVIGHFPIGRRLAFDAARGRLWVVCRSCARWNLTPLQERWEAIEECESVFSTVRTRVSTGNIGLARVREGLELVRIGSALRPEFAAWRYGDRFGRRWRRHLLTAAGAGAAGAGAFIAAPVLGLYFGFFSGVAAIAIGNNIAPLYQQLVARQRVALTPTGSRSIQRIVDVRRRHLAEARLYSRYAQKSMILHLPSDQGTWELADERAVAALRVIMPTINNSGGRGGDVHDAVMHIERSKDPLRFLHGVARNDQRFENPSLQGMNRTYRLALEMAVNEESERAVLEGELKSLEESWKTAEEIAAISDNMFVPEWIDSTIERHRRDFTTQTEIRHHHP